MIEGQEADEASFADDALGTDEPQVPAAGPAPSAVEPEPEAVPEPSAAPWVEPLIEDLPGKTVDELEEIAKARGITGYSSLSKDELVKAIAAEYRERPPAEPRIG